MLKFNRLSSEELTKISGGISGLSALGFVGNAIQVADWGYDAYNRYKHNVKKHGSSISRVK